MNWCLFDMIKSEIANFEEQHGKISQTNEN